MLVLAVVAAWERAIAGRGAVAPKRFLPLLGKQANEYGSQRRAGYMSVCCQLRDLL